MNVATITMDPAEAREQIKEYRAAMRRIKGGTLYQEYQAALWGLSALADGWDLLDLRRAIVEAPTDAKGRPRLAVARADRRQVMFRTDGRRYTFRTKFGWTRGHVTESMTREFDIGRWVHTVPDGYALVPLVPPDGIKAAHGVTSLRYYHILFEVEQWADAPILAGPDRDPYLLRHVHEDLYAIVYEWELTDLERWAMAGRRSG